MFPMLFPDGKGPKPPSMSLKDYAQYRSKQMFTPFTLYPPYKAVSYAAMRTSEILSNTSESVLLSNTLSGHPPSSAQFRFLRDKGLLRSQKQR